MDGYTEGQRFILDFSSHVELLTYVKINVYEHM